jgi:hypothetical protein
MKSVSVWTELDCPRIGLVAGCTTDGELTGQHGDCKPIAVSSFELGM